MKEFKLDTDTLLQDFPSYEKYYSLVIVNNNNEKVVDIDIKEGGIHPRIFKYSTSLCNIMKILDYYNLNFKSQLREGESIKIQELIVNVKEFEFSTKIL